MRLSLLLLLAPVLAACHRGPERCSAAARSTVELHDGSGATTLALKDGLLCDGQLRVVGRLETKDGAVTLRDAGGALRLSLTTESPTVAHGRDQTGPRLRLYRDARELRVLQADGVPLGSVVPEGNAATIFNPASAPLGKVSMRDRDAVVTDMAGTALTYVVPSRAPGPAGVFGIPSLDPAEKLAIYIYWSR